MVAIYPHLTGNSIKKIKQLLVYIAESVPFTLNWQKIKSITEIGDDRTLKTYFKYLEDAYIIRRVAANTHHLKRLEIPDKIFLGNTNQLYTLTNQPNIGNVRETFFLSMLTQQHQVTGMRSPDFCVDNTMYFEIGGKKKTKAQIYNLENAYLVVDDIEQGSGNRIPLWLFGFLY